MPNVTIEWLEGRTIDQKRKVIAGHHRPARRGGRSPARSGAGDVPRHDQAGLGPRRPSRHGPHRRRAVSPRSDPGLHHLLLQTTDLGRAERFYVDFLGFTVRHRDPFPDGRPLTVTNEGLGLTDGAPGPTGAVEHIAFRLPDIRGLAERARRRRHRDNQGAGTGALRVHRVPRRSRRQQDRALLGDRGVTSNDSGPGVRFDRLRIAVIGGDEREPEIARAAASTGASVHGYGFPVPEGGVAGVQIEATPEAAAKGADYCLFPIPLGVGLELYAPGASAPIVADENLLSQLAPGAHLFCGRVTADIAASAAAVGVTVHEYDPDRELMLLRAPAIVEGAIQLAIEHTDITIHDADVVVVGFGNIGSLLARRLLGLGARVHVAARNPIQRAGAYADGAHAADRSTISPLSPPVSTWSSRRCRLESSVATSSNVSHAAALSSTWRRPPTTRTSSWPPSLDIGPCGRGVSASGRRSPSAAASGWASSAESSASRRPDAGRRARTSDEGRGLPGRRRRRRWRRRRHDRATSWPAGAHDRCSSNGPAICSSSCSSGSAGLLSPAHSAPCPHPRRVREGVRHMFRRDSPFSMRPRPDLVPWLVRFMSACRAERVGPATELLRDLSIASLEIHEALAADGLDTGLRAVGCDQHLRDGVGVRGWAHRGGAARPGRHQVSGTHRRRGLRTGAGTQRRPRGWRLLPRRGAVRTGTVHARRRRGGGRGRRRDPYAGRGARTFARDAGPSGRRSTPRQGSCGRGPWSWRTAPRSHDSDVSCGSPSPSRAARATTSTSRRPRRDPAIPSTCRRPGHRHARSPTGSGWPARCSSRASTRASITYGCRATLGCRDTDPQRRRRRLG